MVKCILKYNGKYYEVREINLNGDTELNLLYFDIPESEEDRSDFVSRQPEIPEAEIDKENMYIFDMDDNTFYYKDYSILFSFIEDKDFLHWLITENTVTTIEDYDTYDSLYELYQSLQEIKRAEELHAENNNETSVHKNDSKEEILKDIKKDNDEQLKKELEVALEKFYEIYGDAIFGVMMDFMDKKYN